MFLSNFSSLFAALFLANSSSLRNESQKKSTSHCFGEVFEEEKVTRYVQPDSSVGYLNLSQFILQRPKKAILGLATLCSDFLGKLLLYSCSQINICQDSNVVKGQSKIDPVKLNNDHM